MWNYRISTVSLAPAHYMKQQSPACGNQNCLQISLNVPRQVKLLAVENLALKFYLWSLCEKLTREVGWRGGQGCKTTIRLLQKSREGKSDLTGEQQRLPEGGMRDVFWLYFRQKALWSLSQHSLVTHQPYVFIYSRNT